MGLTVHNHAVDVDASTGAYSLDPTNPTHLLYAGSAIVGAGLVVASVGVTTAVAPGLVLVPGAVAAGMAGAGAYINAQRDDELAAKSDAKSNNAPAPAGA